MLSVCIPIRDIIVGDLLRDLRNQTHGIDLPILLIDDASTDPIVQEANKRNALAYGAQYYENASHLGTGATRNRFATLTQSPFLLFIDAGKQIIRSNYIQTYINVLHDGQADAYCGGVKSPDQYPSRDHFLRYSYGKRYEERDAVYRQDHGARMLCSCNLLVRREIITEIGFTSEQITYGYEDTQLGIQLVQAHYRYMAIDNPIGKKLDSNRVFLQKTHEAIERLYTLLPDIDRHVWIKELPITQAYLILKKYRLLWLSRIGFTLLRSTLRRGLESGYLGCYSLQVYKLGLLLSLTSQTGV